MAVQTDLLVVACSGIQRPDPVVNVIPEHATALQTACQCIRNTFTEIRTFLTV